MYKQKFFSFKRDRYYLLELTYNFAFQAVDYALFRAGLCSFVKCPACLLPPFACIRFPPPRPKRRVIMLFFSVAEGIYGV